MSVLAGEGSHVILYGSTTFTVRTRSHSGYLARPDMAGSHAVAVALGDVTPGMKDLCRQLARRGLAAVAVDPSRAGAVADVAKWISAPGTPWADSARVGVIVTQDGTVPAAAAAASRSIVLLDAAAPVDTGGRPTLGLYGSDGEAASGVRQAASGVPDSQWVFYPGAGAGFWDLGSDHYRSDAAADAVARIIAFLEETLGDPEGP